LGQLRRLSIGIRREAPADPADAEQWAFDQALDVIAVGLSRDNPEISRETLLGLEITLPEMNAASLAILRHSGLVQAKPGEAKAGASSNGGSSTAA
jgi:hypothetical protein